MKPVLDMTDVIGFLAKHYQLAELKRKALKQANEQSRRLADLVFDHGTITDGKWSISQQAFAKFIEEQG